MYILVAYKHEENQTKNEGARVVTTFFSYILDAQGQLTLLLVVNCDRKIKLIPAFVCVLVTCKNEEDILKHEGARVVTTDSHCKSMWIFFYDAQGQLIPQSEVGSI